MISEELTYELKTKKVSELSEKHFSRFGEFLASFELSKFGWNVYNPMYDEYIDLIIHKHVCKKCGQKWNLTPLLVCKSCGKDFTKSNKNSIKTGVCNDCGDLKKGNKIKCANCGGVNVIHRPTCDVCKGEIEMIEHSCICKSKIYVTKFRTIQVKSSRIEFNKGIGKSKNTYAIDMKPKDLIKDKFHFYIWCLLDIEDKPHFLVMSVNDFIETMGNSMKGISFFKDQDRQHFSSKDLGKWKKFLNNFIILE